MILDIDFDTFDGNFGSPDDKEWEHRRDVKAMYSLYSDFTNKNTVL